MIELNGIRKIYQLGDEEVHALDGVDLTIHDHEFVAIIGASGSGKSTLMNIIGCLDTADEGSYFIDGTDVTNMSEHDQAILRNRKIGFIFQQFNLLPKLTAYENVELPLIYQGTPGAERRKRVTAALEKVGLAERMHHRPNQLSGGQQQRVAVARALVTKPSLILADEPTGNLDSRSTRDIMALLGELHEMGNTLVLITHDNQIAAASPRRVQLFDGKVIADTADPSVAAAHAEELRQVSTYLSEGQEHVPRPGSGTCAVQTADTQTARTGVMGSTGREDRLSGGTGIVHQTMHAEAMDRAGSAANTPVQGESQRGGGNL